ncbi:MAG TPA: hypothetical protein PK522_00840 [Nitrosomonas sp.]|nr:hypothetical protein [Nitrosomonas sp.]
MNTTEEIKPSEPVTNKKAEYPDLSGKFRRWLLSYYSGCIGDFGPLNDDDLEIAFKAGYDAAMKESVITDSMMIDFLIKNINNTYLLEINDKWIINLDFDNEYETPRDAIRAAMKESGSL